MTRIQKVLCIFLSVCMLGAAALAVWGFCCRPGSSRSGRWDLWRLFPLYAYGVQTQGKGPLLEDAWTREQLLESEQASLESQVREENQVPEEEEKEKKEEKTEEPEAGNRQEEAKLSLAEAAAMLTPHPRVDLSLERLADYNYLLQQFFIVDQGTVTSPEQLDATKLLGADMTMEQDSSVPQILIYHSHSQEDFTDTVPGDVETTIVGVGNYLTQLLEEQYGYQVLHLTDTFDVIDGSVDRNRAYDVAREKVGKVLEENPSIEVVIDLHRDGVDPDRHLITEIGGKPTAKIMCFNGLSYSALNGPVDYLPNPHIQDNLAFSFQLEMQAAQYYPDLYRGIYLAGLRYNLDLRPKAILLEAGAQTNSSQEVKNAMEPFADILHRVLSGAS